ncbi:hypothetical protein Bbelb_230940 [Branchiostoma belcheri]|nr:hypothetical protein Bbelb_230940 [Branchiostoma belcheri]
MHSAVAVSFLGRRLVGRLMVRWAGPIRRGGGTRETSPHPAGDQTRRHFSRRKKNFKSQIWHQQGPQVDMGDSSNKKLKMASHDADIERFDQVFHQLVTELINEDAKNSEISDAMVRFRKVLEYNCPGGKRNRGLSVITSYRYLVNSDQLTEENIHRAMVVGWCIEWLQAFFLVLDDIMDQSQTRRGQPCWYRVEEVGNMAINDACYIESCIYKLLRRFCRDQPYYVDLLELFQGTTYKTIVGQSLDLITSPDGKVNLSNFTEERYDAIVKYKTAFYSFHLPVAAAMYMAGITSKESHENAKTILLEMGRFFQIQDDYLDCYGDPAVTGKVGTDVEENKCSWLVVQALRLVNNGQLTLLQENYGQNDPMKVAAVKQLYGELRLQDEFWKFEESSYTQLMTLINSSHQDLPKEMFIAFAQKIYKRQK